jgi:hypothetical protein
MPEAQMGLNWKIQRIHISRKKPEYGFLEHDTRPCNNQEKVEERPVWIQEVEC